MTDHDLTPENLRLAALRACRRVLDDLDAKPADILRAAEIVTELRAGSGSGAHAAALDDAALLAIARGGEGGGPPLMGPVVPERDAVPSRARADHSVGHMVSTVGHPPTSPERAGLRTEKHVKDIADTAVRLAQALTPTAGLGWPVSRGTSEGPKRDPRKRDARGRLLPNAKNEPRGTQNEPVISPPAPGHIASPPEMGETPVPNDSIDPLS